MRGDDRTRTDHPLIANQMLYQMSYAPKTEIYIIEFSEKVQSDF